MASVLVGVFNPEAPGKNLKRRSKMNDQNVLSRYQATGGTFLSKLFRNLLEILAAFTPLAVCGTLGHILGLKTIMSGVVIQLGYALSLLSATAILKLRGTGWKDLGLARPKSWPRALLVSLAGIIGTIILINLVSAAAIYLSGSQLSEPDISRFNPITGNLSLLLLVVTFALTTNAFGEEMLFRAFLTTWFADVLHKTRAGWILAALVSSVLFGLAHYGEGITGIFTNGSFGLLFAFIYVRNRRNLLSLIIAHGILNSLRYLLIYFGVV